MTTNWRIYGAEMSPYSVKVRAYFRYKALPHEWLVRTAARMPEFQEFAKLPIIPLVMDPDDRPMQDSTPILEAIENQHPSPSVHPDDPVAAFVSILLEEYGDEWGNKWMFHLRWDRDADQIASASRIARVISPGADDERHLEISAQVRERMVSRVGFVGSNAQTAPIIEASFMRTLALLDAHLAKRCYLFGGRPALGDFGLWAQIRTAWTDPTAYGLIEAHAQNVLAWIQRMEWPHNEGPFEAWSALEPGLGPLLRDEVGACFLPWSIANARALAAGDANFELALADGVWQQTPQKYHAKSLTVLRRKYQALTERTALDTVLGKFGCLVALAQ